MPNKERELDAMVATNNSNSQPNHLPRKNESVLPQNRSVVVVGGSSASAMATAARLASNGGIVCIAESVKQSANIGMSKLKPIPKFDTKLHWGAVVKPPTAMELQELREHSDLTQRGLATLLGLSNRQLISDYERDLKKPNPQTYTLWLLLTGQHPTLQVVNKPTLPRSRFIDKAKDR